jgi:serine/threonine-protein kinase
MNQSASDSTAADLLRSALDDSEGLRASELIDGRYRIIEAIGRGGMGSVYRAEHIGLGRMFAIKLLRSEYCQEAAMVRRFQRESRMAASIESEHVVGIVDTGQLSDGRPYFVMELLSGSNLRAELARETSLSPVRVVNIALDVCHGLQRAHALGLVHRDLKPENLFLTRGDDGREVVKILDFGVAKSEDTVTTQPGALVGTVRYMAPEQVGLDVPLGPATDIYSLGVIVYEGLCGTAPFAADTVERTLYRVMTANPEPLSERVPGLPAGLWDVVATALSRDPNQRFQSASAFADALAPIAGPRRNAGPERARNAAETDSTQVIEAEHVVRAKSAAAVKVAPVRAAEQPENGTAKSTPSRASLWLVGGVAAVLSAAATALFLPASPAELAPRAPSVKQGAPILGAPMATLDRVASDNTLQRAPSEPALAPPSVSGFARPSLAAVAQEPAPSASALRRAPVIRTRPPVAASSSGPAPSSRSPVSVFDPQNPYER